MTAEKRDRFDLEGALRAVAATRENHALPSERDLARFLEARFMEVFPAEQRETVGATLLCTAAMFSAYAEAAGFYLPPDAYFLVAALVGEQLVTDARLLDGRPAA